MGRPGSGRRNTSHKKINVMSTIVKLITAAEAAELATGKDKRRVNIIDLLTEDIKDQAVLGARYYFVPIKFFGAILTPAEVLWLTEILVNAGYSVQQTKNGQLAIYW